MWSIIEDAPRFADKLKAYAEKEYPKWTDHPKTPDRKTRITFELNSRKGKPHAMYQYRFTESGTTGSAVKIQIALYITMFDAQNELRELLDANKNAISKKCGTCAEWDDTKKRHRFCVVRDRCVIQDADDQLIQQLVELMRRFHEATSPFLEQARQLMTEQA